MHQCVGFQTRGKLGHHNIHTRTNATTLPTPCQPAATGSAQSSDFVNQGPGHKKMLDTDPIGHVAEHHAGNWED